MEALAYWTPTKGFNIAGMFDMIEHQQNGYLVRPFEKEDLAEGISWVLNDRERWLRLGARAREKTVQEFTQQLQANRYLNLFTELISK